MRYALSWLLWPVLLGACLVCNAFGMASSSPLLSFNLTYLGLALALFALERLMPHERRWLENCGQIIPDLCHTLLNKGFVQVLVITVTVMGVATAAAPAGGGLWPETWPLALQILLGLVVAELGLYWAHRLSHEWPWLWRFHAVHHSARRLWFFNTGRFHFVDTAVSIALSQPLLLIAGAPKDIFLWVSAITAFIGILTHCNVEMRFGPLSYLFNTPALHRWHHSMELDEGNRNYGENLMLFDLLFRTWFDADRRPPALIGIREAMPPGFLAQLACPFRKAAALPGALPHALPATVLGAPSSGVSSDL